MPESWHSKQVSTNPTQTTLPVKSPPLVLRDDRSVFGVACREIHYLPVIYWLAGTGGFEQMLGDRRLALADTGNFIPHCPDLS